MGGRASYNTQRQAGPSENRGGQQAATADQGARLLTGGGAMSPANGTIVRDIGGILRGQQRGLMREVAIDNALASAARGNVINFMMADGERHTFSKADNGPAAEWVHHINTSRTSDIDRDALAMWINNNF